VSLDSGREVDGSVDGGEKMSSAAGVLGGRDSRLISATDIGGGISITGSSGCTWRIRLRPVFGNPFFSDFSDFSAEEERCFFGDRTGSVLTGSSKG
jgi:hypothetical protein